MLKLPYMHILKFYYIINLFFLPFQPLLSIVYEWVPLSLVNLPPKDEVYEFYVQGKISWVIHLLLWEVVTLGEDRPKLQLGLLDFFYFRRLLFFHILFCLLVVCLYLCLSSLILAILQMFLCFLEVVDELQGRFVR